MADLVLMRALRALSIVAGPYPPSSVPGYVVVRGIGLTSTSSARVDGSPAPFRVTADNVVIVLADPTSYIELLTSDVTASGDPVVTVDVGVRPRLTTSPLQTLRQRVLKAMLSDVYSDAFHGLGAGVDRLAGSTYSSRLVTEVIGRVRDVERQLLEVQGDDEPDESALDRIEILGAEQEGEQGARVSIEIYNRAGERVEAEV